MKYVVVFFSQSGAIKFNRLMEKSNIKCTLSPTPRALSSSCGTCAIINYNGDIKSVITSETESVYVSQSPHKYELVYDNMR